MTARYIIGDTRDVTATMPDASVDLVLTSPPFLALRSYLPADHPDKWREIGSEATPAAFIDMLLELTAEWSRVLTPHGSIAVELGDTYAGGGQGPDAKHEGSLRPVAASHGPGWPLAKSKALIPELYRIALAYGINPLTGQPSPAGQWRVRNVVTWCRPNPPVGALGDKYRPATSDMVIACKSDKRWFDLDAVRNPHQTPDGSPAVVSAGGARALNKSAPGRHTDDRGTIQGNPAGAPPLDYWVIPPTGYSGSHYAVYPPELCRIPVLSMCPRHVCTVCGEPRRRIVESELIPARNGGTRGGKAVAMGNTTIYAKTERSAATLGWTDCGHGDQWRKGVVFDPFAGSGTTLMVATGNDRDAIGVDIDARNADLATERLGMFVTIETHPEVAA